MLRCLGMLVNAFCMVCLLAVACAITSTFIYGNLAASADLLRGKSLRITSSCMKLDDKWVQANVRIQNLSLTPRYVHNVQRSCYVHPVEAFPITVPPAGEQVISVLVGEAAWVMHQPLLAIVDGEEALVFIEYPEVPEQPQAAALEGMVSILE